MKVGLLGSGPLYQDLGSHLFSLLQSCSVYMGTWAGSLGSILVRTTKTSASWTEKISYKNTNPLTGVEIFQTPMRTMRIMLTYSARPFSWIS